MNYKIMSRSSCERYCSQKHTDTAAIISIRSTWDKELPKIGCSKNNKVKYILYLAINDIEDEQYGMTIQDAIKVARFVKTINVNTLIIHCDGGISRSAGIMKAILEYKQENIKIPKTKKPNKLCYKKTLEALSTI